MATGAAADFDATLSRLLTQARRRLEEGAFDDRDQAEAEILWLESLLVPAHPMAGSMADRRRWLDNSWSRARVVRRNAARTRLASTRLRRSALRARLHVV